MVDIRNNLARALTVMAAVMTAQSQTPAGPFTTAQAGAGRSAYQANCASCHLPDLAGRNEAPQLAGPNFMRVWGSRGAGALAQYIQASMPPQNRGGLSQEMGLDLAAFILEPNLGPPG